MQFTLTEGPQNGKQITVPLGQLCIIIGKNAAGKSRILNSIRAQQREFLFLQGNYEAVQGISTVNLESLKGEQMRSTSPTGTASVVSADKDLLPIFQYFFKTLFNTDLTIDGSNFMVNGRILQEEADGVKAVFNLFYYLLSDHETLLLDEPERFFHPTMRSVFISILAEVAQQYNKRIIITSHSTDSIRFDLPNVIIYRASKDGQIINIGDWLGSVTYGNNAKRQQFQDWFKFHSRILFSESLCLVEGVSDEIVLSALKQKFALELGFENIAIEHVANSTHDGGGKSRLHKIQAYSILLNPTFVIADLDIIQEGIAPWFTLPAGEPVATTIQRAKGDHLHILSRGAIENYYLLDPASEFCQTVANALDKKVPAAYEQARMIGLAPAATVKANYQELLDILSAYASAQPGNAMLRDLARSHVINKNTTGQLNRHITETVAGTNISIQMKFNPSVHFTLPAALEQEAQQLNQKLVDALK
jgi:predicted ATPase